VGGVDQERCARGSVRARRAGFELGAFAQLGGGVVTQVRGDVDVGGGGADGVEVAVSGPAEDGGRRDRGVRVAGEADALGVAGSAAATRRAKSASVVGSARRPTRPMPRSVP
jgi:hypothetical protein